MAGYKMVDMSCTNMRAATETSCDTYRLQYVGKVSLHNYSTVQFHKICRISADLFEQSQISQLNVNS